MDKNLSRAISLGSDLYPSTWQAVPRSVGRACQVGGYRSLPNEGGKVRTRSRKDGKKNSEVVHPVWRGQWLSCFYLHRRLSLLPPINVYDGMVFVSSVIFPMHSVRLSLRLAFGGFTIVQRIVIFNVVRIKDSHLAEECSQSKSLRFYGLGMKPIRFQAHNLQENKESSVRFYLFRARLF